MAPAAARNEAASRAARSTRPVPPFVVPPTAFCVVSVSEIRDRLASRRVALFAFVVLARFRFAS